MSHVEAKSTLLQTQQSIRIASTNAIERLLGSATIRQSPNETKLSGRYTAERSSAVPVRWSAWLGLWFGGMV